MTSHSSFVKPGSYTSINQTAGHLHNTGIIRPATVAPPHVHITDVILTSSGVQVTFSGHHQMIQSFSRSEIEALIDEIQQGKVGRDDFHNIAAIADLSPKLLLEIVERTKELIDEEFANDKTVVSLDRYIETIEEQTGIKNIIVLFDDRPKEVSIRIEEWDNLFRDNLKENDLSKFIKQYRIQNCDKINITVSHTEVIE